jgi:hypothetical protein
MYPVQIVLDEGNLAIQLREVQEWFHREGLEPGALNYRLAAAHVRLRIDFTSLRAAAAFAEAFSGSVLDLTPGRQ